MATGAVGKLGTNERWKVEMEKRIKGSRQWRREERKEDKGDEKNEGRSAGGRKVREVEKYRWWEARKEMRR